MREYYKVAANGYIEGFGTNGPDSATEITEAEYQQLRSVFAERPTPPEGYDYCLRDDLSWELVEVEEPELDDAAALAILLGEGGEGA